MTDKWTDRLSEYIDDELAAAERADLEAHLRSCPECPRTLQQLRGVVTRAGQLTDRQPERDLWPEIAARIAAPEAAMAPLTTSTRKRRVSFSIPQLAAASVVLMLMSAATMYLMVKDDSVAPVAPQAARDTGAAPLEHATVRTVVRNYDSAVQELETALSRNRDQLDTATVRILEHNLAVIDRAIMDARTALSREPANPFLSRYLDQAMQKKVQLLRRATSVMRAQT